MCYCRLSVMGQQLFVNKIGIGAVLGKIAMWFAFASCALTNSERQYSVIQECLAAVYATKQFRHYLFGRHFQLMTDHPPLQWLRYSTPPNLVECQQSKLPAPTIAPITSIPIGRPWQMICSRYPGGTFIVQQQPIPTHPRSFRQVALKLLVSRKQHMISTPHPAP